MSRLFNQIQQAQPKEHVFIDPLKSSFKQKQKFNLLPFVCIISLFAGIVIAYFYTDCDIQAPLSNNENISTASIMESTKILAQKDSQSAPEVLDVEIPIPERNFHEIPFEEAVAVADDEIVPEKELTFHSLEWNIAPLRDWIEDHLLDGFPKFQEFRDSLSRFTYLDVTQPIPEKEISAAEKERLEMILRFLKKFKVDAVRIDGSYSRVMANGQAYYVNTVVSQRPRLKLTGITSQEMIFKDENNQEYRKEISQND